jgi:hypothetical protein
MKNWKPASEHMVPKVEGTCGFLPDGKCPYMEEKKKAGEMIKK